MNQKALLSASLAELYQAIERKRRRRNWAIVLTLAFVAGLCVRLLVG